MLFPETHSFIHSSLLSFSRLFSPSSIHSLVYSR
jgi:hypothetical protein